MIEDPSPLNGNIVIPPKAVDYHEDLDPIYDENDIADVENNTKSIFIVLFRRLPNKDFITLLKLFGLYCYSVISFLGRLYFQ